MILGSTLLAMGFPGIYTDTIHNAILFTMLFFHRRLNNA